MKSFALILAFALAAAAQTSDLANQVKTVHPTRVSKPPKLEDFINGHILLGQARIDDFRQNAPSDGAKATRETVAYLSYDDEHLYVVFLCKEEKSKLRARMANRDDISSDDEVAVYLDTFRDRQHVLDFYVNPLGIQADATSTEGQSDDYSYDTLWKSDGRITPDGYAVSIAIPFRSLRFSSASAQIWGIGLGRFIPAINESSYWPYYTSRISGFAPQLGSTEGLERVSAGRNLQVIPYVFGERAQYLNTHFHWDHIQGIPFFAPLQQTTIHSSAEPEDLKRILAAQMQPPYYPIAMPPNLAYRRNNIQIGDLLIRPFPLHHPNGATGYRIESPDRSIVYASDHEHGNASADATLLEHAQNADVLIYDAQYTPEEYEHRRGWGHSTWREAVKLARSANVKQLIVFHHDPSRTDQQLQAIVRDAQAEFKNTIAAKEGWSTTM